MVESLVCLLALMYCYSTIGFGKVICVFSLTLPKHDQTSHWGFRDEGGGVFFTSDKIDYVDCMCSSERF